MLQQWQHHAEKRRQYRNVRVLEYSDWSALVPKSLIDLHLDLKALLDRTDPAKHSVPCRQLVLSAVTGSQILVLPGWIASSACLGCPPTAATQAWHHLSDD